MQEVNSDLVLGVREGAHVTVVTRLYSPWVRLAELYLVLFGMIELLHAVVSP